MQNLVKAQLAAALVAALGITLSAAPSLAADKDSAGTAPEKKTTKVSKKSTKAKAGKEASCKGKEGSCKGKEGSCKGASK